MPALCLNFKIHEPYRFRRYTVFDMGQNSIYEDDDHNCDAILRAARQCYLPANDVLLRCLRQYDGFAVSFSISGVALDMFEQYAPEVIESFQALAETGRAEFTAETYTHSLAFLYSREEFDRQVKEQCARVKALFGKKPVSFKNTDCIYNNDLATALQQMGFKTVLAEGADHVLGWRSANYVYQPSTAPKMALIMRNISLSRDIGVGFGDRSWDQWPLTADKFASWCHAQADNADVISILHDYHIFGLRHRPETGIFDFLAALPAAILADKRFQFVTPSMATKKYKPVGQVDVPQFMSWDEQGSDLTAWLGSDMQKDAIHALYALAPRVSATGDKTLLRDYERLQTADHFHNMSTKWFTSDGPEDRPNPFGNPYDAYITFMNVLADFELRLQSIEENMSQKTVSRRTTSGRKKKTSGTEKATV
ncbi:MAG: glycoside hydrolase family 57 protein [Desulfovibrio sp.]|nr:glycoside hydrolase family 57 protein [Desulfovibrio sp.]